MPVPEIVTVAAIYAVAQEDEKFFKRLDAALGSDWWRDKSRMVVVEYRDVSRDFTTAIISWKGR